MLINLPELINRCAPEVAPVTMQAIVKTESQGNHLAIGLNQGKKLRYGAKNLAQAIAWVDYLERYNYNFDIGLAQVNIKNVHKYGYLARDMLNPCLNLQLATRILLKNYTSALNVSPTRQEALFKAISAYNSGNFQTGFRNGYVYKVVSNATP